MAGDFATGASWSPDGTKLAYSGSANDNTDVFLARADGTSAAAHHRLARHRHLGELEPRRQAHRLRLRARAASPQIYTWTPTARACAASPSRATTTRSRPGRPKGDLIAFSGRDEHRVFDLYTVAVDGGRVTRLTQNHGTNEKPAWAPNGRYLLFSSTRSGKRQLWLMQPDGSNQRQVTNEALGASDPAWGRSSARSQMPSSTLT